MNISTLQKLGLSLAIVSMIALAVPTLATADEAGPGSGEEASPATPKNNHDKRKGWARNKARRSGRRGLMAAKLLKNADKIGLDPSQVETLEAEVSTTQPRLKALRESAKTAAEAGDKDELKHIRKEARGLVKESNKRARDVLTDAQRKEARKVRAKHRGRQNRGKARRGNGRGKNRGKAKGHAKR